ncbi:HNH endonuclease [Pseudooceanicola sp. CBS1P-1]|uniref:HNH nuclease domain-containing protein n=1 Tax=Pseudooceanicola albus TaxID=2692189 RepID=A0A6L7GCV2_9RHOB|nr:MULTISPECIES: HNH endonuclease signature motif containing protein [Pseudooceanicola]MBT9386934.1 HNH endonuclease [Pseudooceanicola endophyticus]MXN21060.1 hypothetical protein [Pseudooceanicola albus]
MTEFRSAPLTKSALNPKVLRITVTPFIDELPLDVRGGSTKDDLAPAALTLRWRHHEVQADLPTYADSQRPRGFIRHRGLFTKTLFEDAGAEVDDVVIFERLGSHEFRLHVEKPDGKRISGAVPSATEEERKRKWVQREARPDQRKFRKGIADRDGLKCAISGCDIPEVLDAAHLHGHADSGSSDPSNGIILRKDLHALFDGGLLRLGLDGKVTIAPSVSDPDYTRYEGTILSTAADLRNLLKRAAA